MKSIKSLIAKLGENSGTTSVSGYWFIKGGIGFKPASTNTNSCENSTSCSGTNLGGVLTGCINSVSCGSSTNPANCLNGLVCPPIK